MLRVCFMRVSTTMCCAASLSIIAVHAASAQQRPVTICLVQSGEYSRSQSQSSGMDAKHLAQAFASQSLPNGSSVVPILVVGFETKDVNRIVEQRGCEYVAELRRHESVDIDPSGMGLSSDVPPMGDRDLILLTLRKADSHKAMAQMAKPPLTLYGRSHSVKFDPFPLFVKEIEKKIARAQRAD